MRGSGMIVMVVLLSGVTMVRTVATKRGSARRAVIKAGARKRESRRGTARGQRMWIGMRVRTLHKCESA